NNFNGSVSAGSFPENVNKDTVDFSFVSSDQNNAVFGELVVITVTVSADGAGSGTPQGMVTFSVDGTAQPQTSLNPSGQAFFSSNSLSVATHSITAHYAGDLNFSMGDSPLPAFSQIVKKDSTTTATVTADT